MVAGLVDSEVRRSSEITLYFYTAHSKKEKKKYPASEQWVFYISIMEYDINTVNLVEERCKYFVSK